jgi:hypothetical protein
MTLRSESQFALVALLTGIGVATAFAVNRWLEAAFWSLAGGFSVFYGIGCFAVWYTEHPTTEDRKLREAAWFVHMYWMNSFGCLVGWFAAWLLHQRYEGVADLG